MDTSRNPVILKIDGFERNIILNRVKSTDIPLVLVFKFLLPLQIDLDNGCWFRTEDWSVYNTFCKIPAHRFSYWLFNGVKPPENRMVCHNCDRPGCVNPEHLFIGTNSDNMQDAKNKHRFSMSIKKMPMLLVQDADFESEISKLNPVTSNKEITLDLTSANQNPRAFVKKLHNGSRGFGHVEVPQSLRKLIAEEALLGTPSKDLQKSFGVSASSVAAYKNGATSCATYNSPNRDLAEANQILANDVSGSARAKLTLALEHITVEKIAESKLSTISQVARDMSSIVKNLEPTAQNVTNNQVIVYRPNQREEDDFEVITVSE